MEVPMGVAPKNNRFTRRFTRRALLGGSASLLLIGCGGSSESPDDTKAANEETTRGADQIGMSVASFDVAADFAAPITVGISDVTGMVLTYGTVELTIAATAPNNASDAVRLTAPFLPLPGRRGARAGTDSSAPAWVTPSESVGVYRTGPVKLPAGFYEVTARWETSVVTTGLEVLEKARVVLPGTAAPTTRNAVITTAGVPASQIDSRATATADLDPRIHSTVIADALAAGRPIVVAATTPVFCQSQFCGPITDVVAELSPKYPAVAFVHLEVWENYDAAKINAAAAEWIWPDGDSGRGANEPWVFAVDAKGMIAKRWANVLDIDELTAWLGEQPT
jgi:hypothetical protein